MKTNATAPKRPPKRTGGMPGVETIFPRKVRKSLSFTATPRVRKLLAAAQKKNKLSRSDTLGLLVTAFAAQIPAALKAHVIEE